MHFQLFTGALYNVKNGNWQSVKLIQLVVSRVEDKLHDLLI